MDRGWGRFRVVGVILFVVILAWTGLSFGQSAPTITSISPSSGPVGATLTITGTNFSSTASSNTVNFSGDVTATPSSASSTQLIVNVPDGAQSGGVTVTTQNGTSNSVTFTIAAPTITSITPNTGAAGDQVQIAGSGFSTTPSKNTVSFFAARSAQPPVETVREDPMTVTGQVAEPVDTDGDGIPDYWENFHGLDSQQPDDPAKDPDGNGITLLDDYLSEGDLAVFLRGTDIPAFGFWGIVVLLSVMGLVLYRNRKRAAVLVWIGGSILVFQAQTGAEDGGIFDFKGLKFRALENVWVTVEDTGQSAVTDAEGNFSIPDVPAGEHRFILEKSSEEKVRTGKMEISSLTKDLGILLVKRFGKPEPETVGGEDPGPTRSEESDSSNARGTVTATIVSAQASQLTVLVPSTASSGPVTVTVGGKTSNSVSFVVTSVPVPALGWVSGVLLTAVLGILIGWVFEKTELNSRGDWINGWS
jgi:hypothetical protein